MKSKPVVLRDAAARDVDDAIDHYLAEAGITLASDFIDAIEAALRHIANHPASGSPRYAIELDLPDLRFWPMKRFPHLIFYVETSDCVDVWRVLHGQTDIPDWLRLSGQGSS